MSVQWPCKGHIFWQRRTILIMLALFFSHSFQIADAQLKDGRYKIVYRGPGPCKGRLLSYKKYGKNYPEKVSFGSPNSTSPVLWDLKKISNGEITLQASNRASCCPAKLSYVSNSCSSKTAQLHKNGGLRFKPLTVDKAKNLYRLDAASRRTCSSKGVGRLGPIVSSTANRCDQSSNNGVQLNLMNSATQNMYWKFIAIRPPSPPPPPSPPSPPARPPPPPPVPAKPSNFCQKSSVRKVYSGRRTASDLSGIRPCYPQTPRAGSPNECCTQCMNDPTCVAFMFVREGSLDCRAQGLPDVGTTGACYLMDSYTGSYDPLNSDFGYYSSKAFD